MEPSSAIDATLRRAMTWHRAGRLAEAEPLYRQVLARRPADSGALHLLGVLQGQLGQTAAAVDLLRKAIALRNDVAEYHTNLGNLLRLAGQLDDAIASLRRAAELAPRSAPLRFHLGIALRDAGQWPQAIDAFRESVRLDGAHVAATDALGRAHQHLSQWTEALAAFDRLIAIHPANSEAHFQRGNALRELGRAPDAIAAFTRAVEIQPTFAAAHGNLGNLLLDKGDTATAIAAYRRVIALQGHLVEAHCNLATALNEAGQVDDALAAVRRAIELDAGYADAHNTLGILLARKGQLDAAIEACQKAVSLNPRSAEAHNNLGVCQENVGRYEDAMAALHRAIEIKSDYAEAHKNMGVMLLRQGDLARGWSEYEWRWGGKEMSRRRRTFAQPQWDGSDIRGRRILLHCEQGFGDTLQFIRYAPLLAARGAAVILQCPGELASLLGRVAGISQIITESESPGNFDVHCPLLSLPKCFKTDQHSIPAAPYLTADPSLAARWATRLPRDPRRRVGLVWAGNPAHKNDRNRSLSLSSLSPLLSVPGCTFHSLQKGPAASQLSAVHRGLLADRAPALHDFEQTAALLADLDLLITVDTSVAHLAGALGRPVWVLLPFVPDWRWGISGPTTPWYATMLLFRQSAPGEWRPCIDAVIRELARAPAITGTAA